MKTIHRDIVGLLIYSLDGKLLLGKKDPKRKGVYNPECWHIIGGGTEEGETQRMALVREVKEEVGLTLGVEQEFVLLDDEGTGKSERLWQGEMVECIMKFSVYKTTINKLADEIRIKLDVELVDYGWFCENELQYITLTPPTVELFRRLHLLPTEIREGKE